MADFAFEDGYDFLSRHVVTLNLDSKGNAQPYETVGTWQFEAFERKTDYLDELWTNPWGKLAEIGRADMPCRFSVYYTWSDSHYHCIFDGYAKSLEECEDIFIRFWSQIKRHEHCNSALPYEWHNYCEHPFNRRRTS